jgi:ribosomal protein S27E
MGELFQYVCPECGSRLCMPDEKHVEVTCYECEHVFAGINGEEKDNETKREDMRPE